VTWSSGGMVSPSSSYPIYCRSALQFGDRSCLEDGRPTSQWSRKRPRNSLARVSQNPSIRGFVSSTRPVISHGGVGSQGVFRVLHEWFARPLRGSSSIIAVGAWRTRTPRSLGKQATPRSRGTTNPATRASREAVHPIRPATEERNRMIRTPPGSRPISDRRLHSCACLVDGGVW